MDSSFYKIIFLSFFVSLAGCQYAFVGLAEKIIEDRKHDEQIFDFSMHTGIVSGLISLEPDTLFEVNIDVWNRKVLLTGRIDDFLMYRKVEEYVLNYPNVKKLFNEISYAKKQNFNVMVGGECKRGENYVDVQNPRSKFDDFLIEQTIRIRLIGLGNSSVFNIHWRSIEGKVYLIGEAYSLENKMKMIRVICGIMDVVDVKSFIEIRPEKSP
ncbi:MAG: BON domain-containing protein [Nitrospinota bacterium]|nr:BON domain-containing protein [Nitrospinota bacterium]